MDIVPRPVLVLVAHGSEHRPLATAFLMDLAQALRQTNTLSEVMPLVMRGQPSVSRFAELLQRVPPDTPIIIVPIFMGRGHYTDHLVPQALGLPRLDPARHLIRYTPPLGCHPDMPQYLADLALSHVQRADLAPDRTTLLLVAHGSSRPSGAGDTTQALAEAIGLTGIFAAVGIGYLEQSPTAESWRERFPGQDLAILPLLMAKGLHGNDDIPRIFEFSQSGGTRRTDDGQAITLIPGLDLTPNLVQMVLELTDSFAP